MNNFALRNDKPQKRSVIIKLCSLIAVFCILASIAIVREGRIFAHDLKKSTESKQVESVNRTSGGETVIDTRQYGKDIIGYNGPVPLTIYLTDGRIDSIVAQENEETPKFFEKASTLLHAWDGMKVQDAMVKKVDAVSGATYSSNAIIENVQAGLKAAGNTEIQQPGNDQKGIEWSIEYTLAILVALAAAILPIFVKNKKYRLVQEFLNVGVLGFWTGTFLDYSVFIRVFANGLPYTLASLLTLLLFVIAFIFPLFGRTNHYCSWVCPMGSLQELAGRVGVHKLHLTPHAVKMLANFRNFLWCLLIISLWSGILASWTDYEIFSAFIIKNASVVVLITASVFILLSFIIMRPFCRFVCPVGTILNHSEGRI